MNPAKVDLPPDTRSVMLVFPDVNGNLRGKLMDASRFADGAAATEGFATTDLLLAVDGMDEPILTLGSRGINSGAADLLLRPDPTTARRLPWHPETTMAVIGDLYEPSGEPCAISPRQVLRRTLDQLRGHGLTVLASFEFEFRLYRHETWEPATSGLSYSPTALAEIREFVQTLQGYSDAMNLGVSVVHTEGAPGLVEVNLDPLPGVDAADAAALLKLTAIQAARQNGLRASFMAKPFTAQEGSSAHVHTSLWNGDGENLFGTAEPGKITTSMNHVVGGMVEHLPVLSLLYNPNVNSYKRLVPGYFAPTTTSWAVDDRSAAVRLLPRGGRESRIELRRPGADCHPYLTLAAVAASARLGLENGVAASQPPGGTWAEAPSSLEAAIGLFRARGPEIDAALGSQFCEYYLKTREWELAAWQNAVSDWERERYG